MAACHFEAGRSSDSSIQLNRILERVIKDSSCVDLESLCIVAEEKVWNIRIDVNILNYEGNAVDCASVACLIALAHFKRPDVTINGDEVVIHTLTEKTPIPMVLHHYPVCVSYAIFNDGKQAVADPSYIEERVSEAAIVFGINSYKELCGLHLGGVTLTNSALLLSCATKGAKRAKIVVDLIKRTLETDAELREKGEAPSFSEAILEHSITSLAQKRLSIQLKKFNMADVLPSLKSEPMEQDEELEDSKVQLIESKTGVLVPQKKGAKGWIANTEEEDETSDQESSDEEDESSEEEDIMIVDAGNEPNRPIAIDSDDSEENETQTVKKML